MLEKVNLKTTLSELAGKKFASFFNNLCLITEKILALFFYNFKEATNLGKSYLIRKIYKRLYSVQRRPFISKFSAPTEKGSEFFDFTLKPLMQSC